MINKDGGTIFRSYGRHSCCERGHRAHGGSPHKGKPCTYLVYFAFITADECQPWTDKENNGNEYFIVVVVVHSEYSII